MSYSEILLEIRILKQRMLSAPPCEKATLLVALLALYESAIHFHSIEAQEELKRVA